MRCPECGRENVETAGKCASCGSDTGERSSVSGAAPAAAWASLVLACLATAAYLLKDQAGGPWAPREHGVLVQVLTVLEFTAPILRAAAFGLGALALLRVIRPPWGLSRIALASASAAAAVAAPRTALATVFLALGILTPSGLGLADVLREHLPTREMPAVGGKPRLSGLAVASLVLALVGTVAGWLPVLASHFEAGQGFPEWLFWGFAVGLAMAMVALGLGCVALVGIRWRPQRFTGTGPATAGIIIGALGSPLSITCMVFGLPVAVVCAVLALGGIVLARRVRRQAV